MPIKDPAKRAAYHKEYMKGWYAKNSDKHKGFVSVSKAKRKAEVMGRVNGLKNRPCADCGQTFPPEAMDFDHLGDKEHGVATLVNQASPWSKIEAEIAKCEVVCSNCHRVRTKARRTAV